MRTAYSIGLALLAITTVHCAEQVQYLPPWYSNHELLAPSVDSMAQQTTPGAQRIAPIYEGNTVEEDGHMDWKIALQPGQCYTFVGVGWAGVKHLYLYLWNPREERVGTEKPERPDVRMRYCPTEGGDFHVQAKTGEGHGAFAVGVYADSGAGNLPPPPGMAPPGMAPPGMAPPGMAPPGMAPPAPLFSPYQP